MRVKAEPQYARDDKVTEEGLFLVNKYIKVLEKMAVASLSNKWEVGPAGHGLKHRQLLDSSFSPHPSG